MWLVVVFFWDHSGAFLGCFLSNVGSLSILEIGLLGFITAIEMTSLHHLSSIWIEGDSTSALLRSHPLFLTDGVSLAQLLYSWYSDYLFSYLQRGKRYGSADKLANHGHLVQNTVWWDNFPVFNWGDFFKDRFRLPTFHFP